ncbi:MAG: 23S rRNA pseudouridine(2604) synthase [Stenotrophomonas maltophilia]|nr:MAG: 23S rRNA pseudouridine(2604) synthase [Stenotrophomonas maltophilia]
MRTRPFTDALAMTEPTRLSKRLAEMLPCSRREAELYIEGGWVTVDGVPVEEAHHRVTDEAIVLLPGALPESLPQQTLLLNKPADLDIDAVLESLGAETQWDEDRSGLRVLRKYLARQQLCVPLERDASGLLVLTQQPGVLRRLVDDAERLEHEYLVDVEGSLDDAGLKRLSQGAGVTSRTLPLKASWQSEQRLRLAGKQFRPGQVRALCQAVGLRVLSIRRLRLGGVTMGKLPLGQWRFLLPGERF